MQDFSHPSKLKLKIAYWYLTHKNLLKKIFLFFCFLVFLSLIGYSIYGFISHFATSNEFDEVISGINKNVINFKLYKIKIQPAPLIVKTANIIKNQENNFDLVVEVENPNNRWFIKKITYQFNIGSVSTPIFEDFILPNQKKFLLALNQALPTLISSPLLKIHNLKYQRVRSPLDVELSDFLLDDIKFVPAGASSLGLPRVKFQATNNSLYNFWEVPLKIILYNRSTPIGVNITSLVQFRSEEIRSVEFVWFEEIPYHITNVLVAPDVNLFAEENYMPAEEEVGELK